MKWRGSLPSIMFSIIVIAMGFEIMPDIVRWGWGMLWIPWLQVILGTFRLAIDLKTLRSRRDGEGR